MISHGEDRVERGSDGFEVGEEGVSEGVVLKIQRKKGQREREEVEERKEHEPDAVPPVDQRRRSQIPTRPSTSPRSPSKQRFQRTRTSASLLRQNLPLLLLLRGLLPPNDEASPPRRARSCTLPTRPLAEVGCRPERGESRPL